MCHLSSNKQDQVKFGIQTKCMLCICLHVMYHTKLFMCVAAVQALMEQNIYDKYIMGRCIIDDNHQYTIKFKY